MKTTKTFLLLAVILICSNFTAAQTFFVPPYDAGMMTHWVVVDQTTGIEEPNKTIPINFTLNQNYPNPFNPTTLIQFGLPRDSDIRLIVFNLLGREIAVLAEGEYTAGTYSVTFNATNLTSGIYLYQLVAGTQRLTGKMILMK